MGSDERSISTCEVSEYMDDDGTESTDQPKTDSHKDDAPAPILKGDSPNPFYGVMASDPVPYTYINAGSWRIGVKANGKYVQSCHASNNGDQAETSILSMQIFKQGRSDTAIILKVCIKTCQSSKETELCQVVPVCEITECKPKNCKTEHDEFMTT